MQLLTYRAMAPDIDPATRDWTGVTVEFRRRWSSLMVQDEMPIRKI